MTVEAGTTLCLPEDLGIEHARTLHGLLLSQRDRDEAVVLDARDIRRVHTAALQLLCMFHQDRHAAGRATRWQSPSQELQAAAAVLGLTALLGLSQDHG